MVRSPGRRDAGQALPLVAVALMAVALAVMALTGLAGAVHERQRAQAVADLVALAGAAGGVEEARAVALANDADLVSIATTGDGVIATIRVGDRQASARASVSLEPRHGAGSA
jgi:hypothetical protein